MNHTENYLLSQREAAEEASDAKAEFIRQYVADNRADIIDSHNKMVFAIESASNKLIADLAHALAVFAKHNSKVAQNGLQAVLDDITDFYAEDLAESEWEESKHG